MLSFQVRRSSVIPPLLLFPRPVVIRQRNILRANISTSTAFRTLLFVGISADVINIIRRYPTTENPIHIQPCWVHVSGYGSLALRGPFIVGPHRQKRWLVRTIHTSPVRKSFLPHRGLWKCRITLLPLAPPTTVICAHLCHVETTSPHLYWKFSRCVLLKLFRHTWFTDSTRLSGNNLLCVSLSKVKYYRNMFGMQTSNAVFGMT